jgi:uncharacterized glyoxalase superfamily protein PhnB
MATKPDMIGITVRNMAEALRFYRLLGLDIPISWNSVEMTKSIDPSWVEPVGHRMGLAFKCDSPAEVDTLYQQIVGRGYAGHKEPWDAFWGQRYAQVVDPDGNLIDLFAPLA